MARIHIRTRNHGTSYGLYTGKRLLAYGDRETIFTIGLAIRKERKERKENS